MRFTRRYCKIVLGMLTVLCTMAYPDTAFAQDRIRRFNDVKSSQSIIRDVDGQHRLVYNEGYLFPYFILMDDNDGSRQVLSLPREMLVRDFVIRDNSVYFCGMRIQSNLHDTCAVVGWFSMDGFPATEVHFTQHELQKSFEQIESYTVFSAGGETHFVVIGRDIEDRYNLFDAQRVSPNLMVFYQPFDPEYFINHQIDDLIVTDHYVVISSQEKLSLTREGYLWAFLKPVSTGYHIFSAQASRCRLGWVSCPKIILESLGRTTFSVNDFVALYKGPHIDYRSRYLSRFDGIGNAVTFVMGSPGERYTFKEARYNADDHVLDIRVDRPTSVFEIRNHRAFFHVDVSTLTRAGVVRGHLLEYDTVFSFTYLRNQHRYEATGYSLEEQVLKLYNYGYNQWGACMPEVTTTIKEYKPLPPFEKWERGGTHYHFRQHEFLTEPTSFPIMTVCGNQ